MNLPSWHAHVSERQTGSWVDCTPDSTVEFARLCHDRSIAATHAEGDALRAASGTGKTGGMGVDDMLVALRARYGWTGAKKVSGFAALWAALVPGTAAVVQGSMSAFGPDDPLSVWDRNFDGGHAVCAMRLDATDRVWWCDPEAPAGTYRGVWVTKAQLAKFVSAFAGAHLVAAILPEAAAAGDPMDALTSYLPGTVATVKPTANVRSGPHLTSSVLRAVTTAESWLVTGTVKGDVDPDGGSDQWYCRWNAGRWEYTAKSNVTALKPMAADDGYTKATQDAAVLAQKAADDAALAAAQQALQEAKDALPKAVEQERLRIASNLARLAD